MKSNKNLLGKENNKIQIKVFYGACLESTCSKEELKSK